ncbi:MAG TPA: AAA-like domain-containing protein [Halomicronema sp.]
MNKKEFNERYEQLTPKQKQTLRLFLDGNADEKIAELMDVTPSNIRHHIANICGKFGFSNEEGEHFRQRQCLVEIFVKHRPQLVNFEVMKKYLGEIPMVEIEFPQGPVPLTSSFYLERDNIETVCKEEILRSGALIRIKAPKQMGKTSLLDRIIEHAGNQNYKTVRLNLREADARQFSNLDSFLRWFSAYISLQLKIPNQIDDYWDEEMIGSKSSCKNYFDSYLLQQIETPLVVALDEVDRIFDFPNISQEFFPMLRSWHEEAKTADIWKQLRLIVVHSTEDYGRLDINQSPFNVGLPVELKEFSEAEVQNLAHLHNLEWKNEPMQHLMKMVGGHPYLIRLALYNLANRHLKLEELLKNAATDAGIYSEHLRRHLETLQQHPKLAVALKQVVNSPEPVKIETMLGYKLDSMGLINRHGDYSSPKCHLYRLYFAPRLND